VDALYAAALRFTGSRAEAEDVVQEAYLRAFRHFDRFNPGTNCRAWLFTIVRNVFLNRVRRAGREVPNDEPPGFEADERMDAAHDASMMSPEEQLFQTILHGDVDRALKALPFVFREVVILADLEGLTYKEIANVIGCPIGTVMSRLSRGRQLLRRALADFGREHGWTKGSERE
jgi:RNA polymerase sigma-70 factor, ECF subfamily